MHSKVFVKALLSGPFSELKVTELMHDEIYHRDLVQALLVFFRDTHNPQYAEFDLSEQTLDSCPNLAAIPQLAVHPSTYKHDKTQQPQQSSSTVVGSAINCKDRDGNVVPPLATIRVELRLRLM